MKKILLFCFFFFFYIFQTFAFDKVEDIFEDIPVDYPYLHELQTLYEKGVIWPTLDKKFHPNDGINRDEFVWMTLQVGCQRCIKPNVSMEYIFSYENTSPFFDIISSNDYLYCIADGVKKNVVKWYDAWYSCKQSTSQWQSAPFCPNDPITLEEAIAFLLRNSSMYSIDENNQMVQNIAWGVSYPSLSNDVGPKNADGSVYTFYGYFQKALSIAFDEYNLKWDKKTLPFLTPDENGNLNPKKHITKQDFLQLAYIIAQVNACSAPQENKSAKVGFDMMNTSCGWWENCKNTWGKNTDTYTFTAFSSFQCDAGVKHAAWFFYNQATKQTIVKVGESLNNFSFWSDGNWMIQYMIEDNCGNTSLSQKQFLIWENHYYVKIWSTDVSWNKNGKSFEAGSNCSDCRFEWDFGDGESSVWWSTSHVYQNPWIYQVKVTGKDGNGNIIQDTVMVQIETILDLSKVDTDGDGVMDNVDKCPTLPWDQKNSGCPIFGTQCDPNASVSTCGGWLVCGKSGICEVDTTKQIFSQSNICLLSGNNIWGIFGGVMCHACPCEYTADFLASIRKCDLIIPAIVSPDGKEIYGKGDGYQIPSDFWE